MSETVTPATAVTITPGTLMSTSGGIAPAVGSMGIGGASVVVITWLLGLVHVQLPADVSIAMVTLVSAGAHYLQDAYFGPNATPAKG